MKDQNLSPSDMLTYMYNFGIEGNVYDHTWYKIFRWKKSDKCPQGKPHLEAIALLADIFYWYRPRVEKDANGKISIHKRFASDILQRSYSQIEESLGLSDREAKTGLQTLEEYGVAWRVFRTITIGGVSVPNIMYIGFDPEKLKELMLKHLRECEFPEVEPESGNEVLKYLPPYDVQTSHPPRSNVTPTTFKRQYTETSSETTSEKNCSVAERVSAPAAAPIEEVSGNSDPEKSHEEKVPHRLTLQTHSGPLEVDESMLYSKIVRSNVSWSSDAIRYAWGILASYKGIVGDWWRFIEGTVEKFHFAEKSKKATNGGRQRSVSARSSESTATVSQRPTELDPKIEVGQLYRMLKAKGL